MARAGGGGGGGGGITNAVNVGIAVQADWENREFISHISLNIRRLFDFLIQFESTTKSKLSSLNLKLDTLERRLQLLELQVDKNAGTTSTTLHVAAACYPLFMPGSTISSVLDSLMQGFACRKVISLVYMEIQADMLVIHD
ncbi:hypothetical protein NC652_032146 [Populus alba x Populus x berolinensis]|nr:hypothetical protein NC652_032146 [Populus alba x Populus x berolinensis]